MPRNAWFGTWMTAAALAAVGLPGCDRQSIAYDPDFSLAVATGRIDSGELLELALYRGASEEEWPQPEVLSSQRAILRVAGNSSGARLVLEALRERHQPVEMRIRGERCVLYLRAKGTGDRLGVMQVLLRGGPAWVTPLPREGAAGFEVDPLEGALFAAAGRDLCPRE